MKKNNIHGAETYLDRCEFQTERILGCGIFFSLRVIQFVLR